MNNVINLDEAMEQRRKCAVAPAALLPALEQLRKQSPVNYAFIVDTLSIYTGIHYLNMKTE